MSNVPFRKAAVAVAVLSLGLSATAFGQTTPSTADKATTRADTKARSDSALASKDRKFIEEAAKGGMAEVELGKLAEQKASSPQVKDFASRMVQDHGKANDELKQIASAKGVQVPTDVDKKHKRDVERLQKLSGAEFDREYMKHMVSDHKKDVDDFKDAAKSAKDPELKSFASKTLPTLEQHLKMAQSTEAAVKGNRDKQAQGATGPAGGTQTSSGKSKY